MLKPGPTGHIAVWALVSLFRRFTDTNVYRTGSVKMGKLATNIRGYTDIFTVRLSVLLNRRVKNGMRQKRTTHC